jgi:hypothetical protein
MRLMLALCIAGVLAALAAGTDTPPSVAGSARTTKALPVLGISYREPYWTSKLAWFDPITLRKLPGRKVPLGDHIGSWAFSAERGVLAVASRCDPGPSEIRFVNGRAMRVFGDLPIPPGTGCVSALAWLRSDRLLAVVGSSNGSQIEIVDPLGRRLLRRTALLSTPWRASQTRDELVLLLGSDGSFAPARVATVDAEGTLRVVTVDRVLVGGIVDRTGDHYRSRTISPGFAVDPDSRRAFLIPAAGPVAEIDLATLSVSYHELDRPSLLGRLVRWLEPAAEAKLIEGPVREAGWLGDGMIGVSGVNYSLARNAAGEEVVLASPVGLKLIDTRSWSSRMLNPQASAFGAAPGLVIAQGGFWDPGQDRATGPGLVAFGLDGGVRWRLHPGEYRWMDVVGDLGYTYTAEGRAEVIEIATGLIVKRLARDDSVDPWPQLLAAQTSSR